MIDSQVNSDTYPKYQSGYNLAKRDYENSPGLHMLDRIQVQVGEGRHAFLLRHITQWHWSGYVELPIRLWSEYHIDISDKFYASFEECRLDYAARSYDPICWMQENLNGDLKEPADRTKDDFWIGFYCPNAIDHEQALEWLLALENICEKIKNDNTSF